MVYIRPIFSFIITVLLTNSCVSQSYRFLQTEIYGFSANAGYNMNNYTASFTEFQGSISCNEFTSGKGKGGSIGAQFEMPIQHMSVISLGVQYNDRSGSLKNNSIFPLRNIASNSIINALTENQISTTLQTIDIQTDYRYNIVENYNVIIRGFSGLQMRLPITSEFSQTESIISPDNAVFTNAGVNTQSRVIASGTMNTVNSAGFSAIIGLEPLIRISPVMHLSTHCTYEIPLSNIVNDVPWKAAAIRFGLGLRYSIRSYAPSPNMP